MNIHFFKNRTITKPLFLIVFMLGVFVQSYAQLGGSHQEDTSEDTIAIDENTIIRDLSGNIVEIEQFMKLMETGEYGLDEIKDDKGKLKYIQMRKINEEEKKMFKEMQSQMANMPKPGDEAKLIGKEVPNFSIVDGQGKSISLSDLKDKVVVVNCWFTKCQPCIDELPFINKLYDRFKDNPDVVFAAITFNNKQQSDEFLKRHTIKYPIFNNAKSTLQELGILAFPSNMVIDKTGKYADYLVGSVPNLTERLTEVIENTLEE